MSDDPDAALARRHQREASRRRLQDSQREDLLCAARTLIPDHGITMPLARIALRARLTAHAAKSLYSTTTDLALAVVAGAWNALIEGLDPAEDATPLDYVTRLIGLIHADPVPHRIHRAVCCGTVTWQRTGLAEADAFLAKVIGTQLRQTWAPLGLPPGFGWDAAEAVGGLLLALARHAALDSQGNALGQAPNAAARAATVLAMLKLELAEIAAATDAAPAEPLPTPPLLPVQSRPNRPHPRRPGPAEPRADAPPYAGRTAHARPPAPPPAFERPLAVHDPPSHAA